MTEQSLINVLILVLDFSKADLSFKASRSKNFNPQYNWMENGSYVLLKELHTIRTLKKAETTHTALG